jgi:hypothetical protein
VEETSLIYNAQATPQADGHRFVPHKTARAWELAGADRGPTFSPSTSVGRSHLVGGVPPSNVLALVRWPFAALARRIGVDAATGETREAPPSSVSGPGVSADTPIEVDAETLSRLIGSGNCVLVDFRTKWYGFCA